MSKSNIETEIHTIQMPIDPTYKIISTKVNPVNKELFIITGINEKEYNNLKQNNDIILKRGNAEFNITPDDIFCFGDIDFHEGSDDCKELDTFNWLEQLVAKGITIPAHYNYNKHECTTNKIFYLITETFRNSVICRYLHGCLGKPKYTLIFREVI